MNAEFVDDGFDIIITREAGDYEVSEDSGYFTQYLVGKTMAAIVNSIDFTAEEYMDDCGYLYAIGELLVMGNVYGVYPFCVDVADTTSVYYVTPENLDELKRVGRTIIEAN